MRVLRTLQSFQFQLFQLCLLYSRALESAIYKNIQLDIWLFPTLEQTLHGNIFAMRSDRGKALGATGHLLLKLVRTAFLGKSQTSFRSPFRRHPGSGSSHFAVSDFLRALRCLSGGCEPPENALIKPLLMLGEILERLSSTPLWTRAARADSEEFMSRCR